MIYKWENLTAGNFKEVVESCDKLCIIPLGVIEKHGPHLPLGTDLFHVTKIAELASELEPAVIFPPYYLTMIHEAKTQPGTIAISTSFVSDLLENVCNEIFRNGFHKILLLNGHGGNETFLQQFVSSMTVEKKQEYNLYLASLDHYWYPALKDERYLCLKTDSSAGGHGGEAETSLILAINKNLVQMGLLDQYNEEFNDQKGLENLHGYASVPGLDWYARFPNHYAGDGKSGTEEKGKILLQILSEKVAEIIKVVKADSNVKKFKNEFFNGQSRLTNQESS